MRGIRQGIGLARIGLLCLVSACAGDSTAFFQQIEGLRSGTDAQAIEIIRDSQDEQILRIAALNAVWRDRSEVLRGALTRIDPNLPFTAQNLRETIFYVANDLNRPGEILPALMGYTQQMVVPDQRPIIPLAAMARSLPSFQVLTAAGARLDDQRRLDDALYIAVAFGADTALAERLLEMGARLDAPQRPGAMPLVHAAAAYGDPALLAWGLSKGLNPHERHSSARDPQWRAPQTEARHYYRDFTPLHMIALRSTNYPAVTDAFSQRAVDVARVLLAAGADINARATYNYSYGRDEPMEGWTPLHAAYLYHHMPERRYGELVAFLEESGADRAFATSSGATPSQVAGLIGRTNRQHQAQQLQARRAREQRERQQAARSGSSSGDLFGQFMAAAGMAAVTGAAISSGMNASAASRIGAAGMADIATAGRSNQLSGVTRQMQAQQRPTMPQRNIATTPASAPTPSGGFQSENYSLSCPSGVTNTIPLRYRTQQCRNAMIDFARAYGCNDHTRFSQVEAGCQNACGHRQCLQQ